MVTSDQAEAAKEGLQGEQIEGRTLSIEKARRAKPRTPTPGKYFGPPKRGTFYTKSSFSSAQLTWLQTLVRVSTTAVDPEAAATVVTTLTATAGTTGVAMSVATTTAVTVAMIVGIVTIGATKTEEAIGITIGVTAMTVTGAGIAMLDVRSANATLLVVVAALVGTIAATATTAHLTALAMPPPAVLATATLPLVATPMEVRNTTERPLLLPC
jgi:hypothetical protein